MKYLMTFLMLIIGFIGYPQIEEKKTFKVPIKNSDSNLHVEVDNTNHKAKVREDLVYYWFKSKQVHFTRGDYSGKLLHGEFIAYYKSNQLKERGEFKYGLKDGLWTEWYENGEKKSELNWKNGKEDGEQKHYDEKGNVRVTKYKNGIIKPTENIPEEIVVPNDSIVTESDTIEVKKKRFKIFNKKNKVESSDSEI